MRTWVIRALVFLCLLACVVLLSAIPTDHPAWNHHCPLPQRTRQDRVGFAPGRDEHPEDVLWDLGDRVYERGERLSDAIRRRGCDCGVELGARRGGERVEVCRAVVRGAML